MRVPQEDGASKAAPTTSSSKWNFWLLSRWTGDLGILRDPAGTQRAWGLRRGAGIHGEGAACMVLTTKSQGKDHGHQQW